MDLGIMGRRALVCGGSRGLGLAAAEALAAEGCDVALCARPSTDLDEAAARLVGQYGVRVVAAPADLGDLDQAVGAVRASTEAMGRIDILVNNNGGPPTGRWDQFQAKHWQKAVEMTLFSAQAMTGEVLPGMLEQGWGRVINLTSVAVKQPLPGLMLSNSVRAAVVGWAKTLADEVAPGGVTVNNVCMGWIQTRRVDNLLDARASQQGISREEALASVLPGIPAGRLGQPEELGSLVAFLASQRAAYITGVSYAIDGGLCRALL